MKKRASTFFWCKRKGLSRFVARSLLITKRVKNKNGSRYQRLPVRLLCAGVSIIFLTPEISFCSFRGRFGRMDVRVKLRALLGFNFEIFYAHFRLCSQNEG